MTAGISDVNRDEIVAWFGGLVGRKRSAGNERLGEHLQRKASGVIELRFPLPEDVRYAFPDDQGRPRKQFIQSLGTRDVQTANNKADPIRTAIKDRINRIYPARRGDELPNFLRQIYEWEVGEAEPPKQADAEVARRRALVGLDEEPANVVPIRPQRLGDAIAAVLDRPPSREVRMLDRVLHGRSLAKPHHQPGEKAALAGWVADAYFEQVLGVRPAPSSPEYQAVLHQGFETLADAHFAKMDIEAGRIPPPSKYGAAPEGLALGGVDLTSPAGRMTMGVIAAVAEFERDLLVERTQAGLGRAKAQGKRLGRPSRLTPEQQLEIAGARLDGKSLGTLAKEYGVSRAAIQRAEKRRSHP